MRSNRANGLQCVKREEGGGGGGKASNQRSFKRGGWRRHHKPIMSRQFRQKMNCTTPQVSLVLALSR